MIHIDRIKRVPGVDFKLNLHQNEITTTKISMEKYSSSSIYEINPS